MKPETCDLYRHYDKEWNLLYVGISLNAIKRLIDHRSQSKEWFDEIAFTQRKTFPSRAEAEKAEAIAIRNENPKHNIDRPLGTAPQELYNPTQDLVQCLKEQADFVKDRKHWEEIQGKIDAIQESHDEEIALNNRLRSMLVELRREFEVHMGHEEFGSKESNSIPMFKRIQNQGAVEEAMAIHLDRLTNYLGLEYDGVNKTLSKKKLPKGGKKALEKQVI